MVSSQDPPQTPPFHWHYADLDDTTATTTYQLRGRTLFYVVILFAIILLASLLFFYAKWVCSTRRHSPYRSSSSPAAASDDGLRRRRGGGGLEAAVISALPVLLYGSELVVERLEECCICLSLFEEDEKVKVLPGCNHCFHSECVDRWLVSQSSCPLCRSTLRFDQPSAAVATQIVIDQ